MSSLGLTNIGENVTKVEAILPNFNAVRWSDARGTLCAIVRCDRERPRDNTGLVDETVIIDAKLYKVHAVERHMPATPISPGEEIGLHVTPVAEDDH